MLTKKEVKRTILEELQIIATYSKYQNLQKYIAGQVQIFRNIIFSMVKVYNRQHQQIFIAEDFVEIVLQENENLAKNLSDWYDCSNYALTYVLLRKELKK